MSMYEDEGSKSQGFSVSSDQLIESFKEEVESYFPTKRFRVTSEIKGSSYILTPGKEYLICVDYSFISFFEHHLSTIVEIGEIEEGVVVNKFHISDDILFNLVHPNSKSVGLLEMEEMSDDVPDITDPVVMGRIMELLNKFYPVNKEDSQ